MFFYFLKFFCLQKVSPSLMPFYFGFMGLLSSYSFWFAKFLGCIMMLNKFLFVCYGQW
jgi:hypothetical protein